MNKIIHVVGNRPQFIKLAVLFNEIAGNSDIEQTIVHSGQHYSYNMSELFFKELHIPPADINFNINALSRDQFIIEAAERFEKYFKENKDSAVLVYGDTNTTLAAAEAANKTGLPLLHFEAGVRTYDNTMPEEMNRVRTDGLSDVNYCCTAKNYATMQAEGYGTAIKNDLVLTGDLMLDAFLKIEPAENISAPHNEYVLCTIHREANLINNESLKHIIEALNEIHLVIPVLLPLHPHTKRKIEEYGLVSKFEMLPPLGYPEMKHLLMKAKAVITDSGGMSREAYFAQKRSVIIMDEVFWPEISEMNCSLKSSANKDMIVESFYNLPNLNADFTTRIFGNGKASGNIVRHLNEYLPSV